MGSVLNITSPIFFLILVGYLGVRQGLIPKESLLGLSRFVLYFALPSLVFTKVLSMDLGQVINPQYMAIYAVSGIGAFCFTVVVSRVLFKDKWDMAGIRGMGSSMPNSSFIGLPVLLQLFGHAPTQAFAMAVMVENIVLMPVGLIFIETALGHKQSRGGVFLSVAKRVITNPIILAVSLGVIGSLVDLSLPVFIARGLDMLAASSVAAALIVIGGSLVGVSVKGNVRKMSVVAFSKLFVFPSLAVILVSSLPPMSHELRLSVILFSAVPMFSIYPIIGGQYGERSFCASTLLITTVLSFVTLSLLLHFLH